MPRSFLVILTVLAFGVVAFFAFVVLRGAPLTGLEPLPAQPPALRFGELPTGVIAVQNMAAFQPTNGFRLEYDPSSGRGVVLALPDRRGANDGLGRGRAEIATQAARYRPWFRVRWNDSCGNSVGFRVDDRPVQTIGQDSVYRVWHWVCGTPVDLSDGTHVLGLYGREDGIAVDQVLLSPDESFRPIGVYVNGEMHSDKTLAARSFGDDFGRSPGHGLGPWSVSNGQWHIEFTLDPNRIPNQYALIGACDRAGSPAMLRLDQPPWRGFRFEFAVRPRAGSCFGLLATDGVDDLRVTFAAEPDRKTLRVLSAGRELRCEAGDALRIGQWHRVTVERWAWTLRVSLDGRVFLEDHDIPPAVMTPALLVERGAAVFDDIQLHGISWHAEDARDFRLPWAVSHGGEWYRSGSGSEDPVLLGRRGSISLPPGLPPVGEIAVVEDPSAPACVYAPGLRERGLPGLRCFAAPGEAAPADAIRVSAGKTDARLRRISLRHGRVHRDIDVEGPYDFSSNRVEDPSDYLEFTEEEFRRIRESPEADKLIRKAKYRAVVGGAERSLWIREAGSWYVRQGALCGTGPGARVRFWQEFPCDVELRFRLRLQDPAAAVECLLHDRPGPAARVRLAVSSGEAPTNGVALVVKDQWHDIRIRTAPGEVLARVDDGEWTRGRVARDVGGTISFNILRGGVRLDDVRFCVPRRGDGHSFDAFRARATDWWREGGDWVDHGGVSCVLVSNWTTLNAPEGRGTMWHKRAFGPDVMIGFGVEETSEWFGWHTPPGHVHYPYDNICVHLATSREFDAGYRLEVNARNRSATVLYRNGREVMQVPQDGAFPIRYRGGHSPYSPRRNAVTLVKRGAIVRALINRREVLRYRDPDPLAVSCVGLGGYRTHINFSNVAIREL